MMLKIVIGTQHSSHFEIINGFQVVVASVQFNILWGIVPIGTYHDPVGTYLDLQDYEWSESYEHVLRKLRVRLDPGLRINPYEVDPLAS